MVAFGEYADDGTASTCKARDYKDATDLVAQPIPLNSMTFGRDNEKTTRQCLGVGEPGDPIPTLSKAHSHAVAQPTYAVRTANTTANGHGISKETAHTLDLANGQAVAQPIVAPSLTASNDPSRSPQSSEVTQQVAAVHAASMAVRRLTPIECERLQGFPDNYTNIPWRKSAEAPDGPRYKALGNSMAVPVMRWIGQRIAQVDELLS
jgi:DNA (cytosine-5)-methyltransferase 1